MFCSQKLGCLPLEQETNGWERQIKPVRLTSETLLGFSRAKMLQIPPPKKTKNGSVLTNIHKQYL